MPSAKTQPQQQELFQIEGNILPRTQIRDISKNADYMRKVDISLIRIRPDLFNARVKPTEMPEQLWNDVLMVPDLAEKILANGGPADPILGDFRTDGLFYITNGERRFRAIWHLLNNGELYYDQDGERPISEVYVLLNPPGTTDLERKKKMYTTNENLPFTPMQRCHYFASLKKEPFNLTLDQIADEFKMSRQSIGNYILATTLPAETQEKIDSGEIKITNALGDYRKDKQKTKLPVITDDPILTAAQERKEKEEAIAQGKLRGDEDEFITQDNSKTFAGSKILPEDKGSGAIVLGADSIYVQEQTKATWKQFLNRIRVLNTSSSIDFNEDKLIERLTNEYTISVK